MEFTRRQFIRAACSAPLVMACAAACAPVGRDAETLSAGTSAGGGEGASEWRERQASFFAFDTACVIGGVMRQDTLDRAKEQCRVFESLFSRTMDTSDVSRINAAGGAPVQVAPETAELIALALGYCEASGGLFDITIGAVSQLWDFKGGVVPPAESILEALPHVGYRTVQVDGETVTLADPDARLDLGGIAKGYIADKLCEALEADGVRSGFVNLGGNVKVIGAKADGSPWRVGVRDPEAASDDDVVATIESTGGSLVTSGLYERRFQADGRWWWHILDPRTGYPVETDIVSASVYSSRSIDGDGFTKPLFMLSVQDALAFADAQGDLGVLLIGSDGTFHENAASAFAFSHSPN